jgi:hypothetical protein
LTGDDDDDSKKRREQKIEMEADTLNFPLHLKRLNVEE